jgi:hypothetical protein
MMLLTPAETQDVLQLCGYAQPQVTWNREAFENRTFIITAINRMHAAAADKTRDYLRNIAVLQGAGNSPLALNWRVALCEWMNVTPGPELAALIEEQEDG